MNKPGRNDPCPCGSGKKYKQCCINKSSNKSNVFDRIYEQDLWVGGSGPGSHPRATLEYRYTLEKFLYDNDVKSVVDFGCGDWQFSKYIHWGEIDYTGYDVANMVLTNNTKNFSTKKIRFERTPDDLNNMKEADLFIAKESLMHLPNDYVDKVLTSAFDKYKYLLITNGYRVDAPGNNTNQDIQPGAWRHLDIRLPPFSKHAEVLLVYQSPPGIGMFITEHDVLLCRGGQQFDNNAEDYK